MLINTYSNVRHVVFFVGVRESGAIDIVILIFKTVLYTILRMHSTSAMGSRAA